MKWVMRLVGSLVQFWCFESETCGHKIFVSGAGIFYDELVCEECGHRIYDGHVQDDVTVREIKEGELFHTDGVY